MGVRLRKEDGGSPSPAAPPSRGVLVQIPLGPALFQGTSVLGRGPAGPAPPAPGGRDPQLSVESPEGEAALAALGKEGSRSGPSAQDPLRSCFLLIFFLALISKLSLFPREHNVFF